MKSTNSPKKSIFVTLLWYVAWMAFLFPSCAPKVIPIEPIQPKVVRLRTHLETTAKAAQKVEVEAKKAQQSVTDEKKLIDKGEKNAELLKTSKVVTQEQLDANEKLWQELLTSNQKAIETTTITATDASEVKVEATQNSTDTAQLEQDAGKVDSGVSALKVENASLAEDASAWKKLKWAIWIIGGILFLMFLVFEVLPKIIKAAKPPGT